MGTVGNILIIVFLMLLNAVIVAAEMALVSVRRSRIETLARKGNRDAALVRGALENLQNYIIITQLGNTVVSLSLGWWGEQIVAGFFNNWLPHGSLTVIFSLIILTLMQVLVGELVPKGIVIRDPEAYSLFLIKPLAFFLRLSYPLVRAVDRTVDRIIKMLGISNKSTTSHYTYGEIRTILRESVKKKLVSLNEFALMDNVMRLKRVSLKQVLITKKNIVGFPGDMTFAKVRQVITEKNHNFNRYPVYKKDMNYIIGFMHVREIFSRENGAAGHLSLSRSGKIRPVIYCKDTTKPDELLLKMHRNHVYVAIVRNTAGKIIGMVTSADLLNHWLLRIS
ncbi:hemolysin family protein [Patescibacteria group bacterium]|nr:hemolysin family protein [Patescibacteria group bacterium]MCL5091266.1 hemolysin family protein [Patescibacteria group bacterium]